jgi:hypothetical protein
MCVVALLLAVPALAQVPAGWIADPESGCRVRNPSPEPGEAITWKGGCEKSIAEGRGTLLWFMNGKPTNRYEGEIRNGMYNGRGVYTWANGGRYDGEWRNGVKEGKGVYTWASGNRYEGEFRNDMQNGHGVLISRGGSRYDGQWLDDQAHGPGTLTFNDGAIVKGTWTKGCLRQGGRPLKIGAGVQNCD